MQSRRPKASGHKVEKSKAISFFLFSLLILIIKTVWLSSQPGRGILGADGENYLKALEGLLLEGFFSREEKLSYWPAGYPILMWPLAKLSLSNFLFQVGILQSAVFALVITFFAVELRHSPLKKFAWPSLFFLSLNPTLSLNSPAIGYEVSVACLFILSITLYMRIIRTKKDHAISVESTIAAISFAFSAFMQPRILLIALGILIPFAIFQYRGKRVVIFLIFSSLLISSAPTILILRNQSAVGVATISTNLGVTMNIGAGPKATGGYSNEASGVPCRTVTGNATVQDRNLINCVVRWYLQNPSDASRLFVSKFLFHWSPWFGPLANGTMARNPWLKFNPLSDISKTQDGYDMVYGLPGKSLSWLWLIATIMLVLVGFLALRRRGGTSSWLAWALFMPVLLNSLSSMATIGDHRFRLPTATMSILLQMFGLYSIFSRKEFKREIEGQVKLNHGFKIVALFVKPRSKN